MVALTLEHIGAYGAHTRWPTSSSGWDAQMLRTPSGAVFQFSSLINAGIIDTNCYFTTSYYPTLIRFMLMAFGQSVRPFSSRRK